jgi:hypothetical protein
MKLSKPFLVASTVFAFGSMVYSQSKYFTFTNPSSTFYVLDLPENQKFTSVAEVKKNAEFGELIARFANLATKGVELRPHSAKCTDWSYSGIVGESVIFRVKTYLSSVHITNPLYSTVGDYLASAKNSARHTLVVVGFCSPISTETNTEITYIYIPKKNLISVKHLAIPFPGRFSFQLDDSSGNLTINFVE